MIFCESDIASLVTDKTCYYICGVCLQGTKKAKVSAAKKMFYPQQITIVPHKISTIACIFILFNRAQCIHELKTTCSGVLFLDRSMQNGYAKYRLRDKLYKSKKRIVSKKKGGGKFHLIDLKDLAPFDVLSNGRYSSVTNHQHRS